MIVEEIVLRHVKLEGFLKSFVRGHFRHTCECKGESFFLVKIDPDKDHLVLNTGLFWVNAPPPFGELIKPEFATTSELNQMADHLTCLFGHGLVGYLPLGPVVASDIWKEQYQGASSAVRHGPSLTCPCGVSTEREEWVVMPINNPYRHDALNDLRDSLPEGVPMYALAKWVAKS